MISVKEGGDHDPGDDDRGNEPQDEYQGLIDPRSAAAVAAACKLAHEGVPVHLPTDEYRNEDSGNRNGRNRKCGRCAGVYHGRCNYGIRGYGKFP